MISLVAVAAATTRPDPLAATVALHGVTNAANGPPYAGSVIEHGIV